MTDLLGEPLIWHLRHDGNQAHFRITGSGIKTCVGRILYRGFAKIDEVFLEEKKQGLGKKIIAFLEEKLKNLKVSKISLETFPSAVGFWVKQGYRVRYQSGTFIKSEKILTWKQKTS